MAALTYSVVTPVRNELENLRRLSRCLSVQTVRPINWLVIDDGSTDHTAPFVTALAREHPWVRLGSTCRSTGLQRGGPIVRAFHAGLRMLDPLPPVVVKLDADVSMAPDYFERLLHAFERDPRLGIAGGVCFERDKKGMWRQRHGTGPDVWGASRAYRRECLEAVLPLEERMGWDTIDLVKANVKGWKTVAVQELPFRHHRPEGVRDRSQLRSAMIKGEAAHYMAYRPSYLALRTLFQMLREPAAVGLILGYARAAAERRPQCGDAEVKAYIRSLQLFRNLPQRAREILRPKVPLSQH